MAVDFPLTDNHRRYLAAFDRLLASQTGAEYRDARNAMRAELAAMPKLKDNHAECVGCGRRITGHNGGQSCRSCAASQRRLAA